MSAPGHRPDGDPCKCGQPAAAHRPSHNPKGDPCSDCGAPAYKHRVKHKPDGDPCSCGASHNNHLKTHESIMKKRNARTYDDRLYYVGLDGEGQNVPDDSIECPDEKCKAAPGKPCRSLPRGELHRKRCDHKYVMLAWSSEDGTQQQCIEAPMGKQLSTEECLDFILDIPTHAKPFGFALGYDWTKILTDVDDRTLYLLLRPELRPRPADQQKLGPRPVSWRSPSGSVYRLNMMGTMFSISHGQTKKTVWDVFKFFQARFTSAVKDWFERDDRWTRMKPVIEHMVKMKEQRSEFDKVDRKKIREYCYDECRYMAALAQKLTEAHEAAGLPLTRYYSAGSTAGAMLKKMGIKGETRHAPEKMDSAVASGFFGGRFENSILGAVEGPVWGYDISSAYPYQLYHLPCLGCGTWRLTKKRKDLDKATASLVHYGLPPLPRNSKPTWGPFPFRTKSGAIAFPSSSGGGWVWDQEYLEGERLFPNVEFREAWVYETTCSHRPFANIPRYYLERLRIGKEGPGIVIKLGCNSCYGKFAQSVGTAPPFQSWPWAGMITSRTRGQLLTVLGLHQDRTNMLINATDGIYSREKLETPKPTPCVTEQMFADIALQHGQAECDRVRALYAEKPLGGWERNVVDKGIFCARPGIYFPLNPTDKEIDKVRARGLGRKTMYDSWRALVEAWDARRPSVEVANVSRFWGAKSCVSYVVRDGKKEYRRSVRYGQWRDQPVTLKFDPKPKRDHARKDGTLVVRTFPQDEESRPYKRSLLSPEALELKLKELLDWEQPDGGYEPEDLNA